MRKNLFLTHYVNANLVWNVYSDMLSIFDPNLSKSLNDMQWFWIENICNYLSKFFIIQPVKFIGIILFFTLVIQNITFVRSFCPSKIFTKLSCTGITDFIFLETLAKFTVSNPQFPRLYIPAWIQYIDANWFVFHCKYMSCIFLFPNRHFQIDWCLKDVLNFLLLFAYVLVWKYTMFAYV